MCDFIPRTRALLDSTYSRGRGGGVRFLCEDVELCVSLCLLCEDADSLEDGLVETHLHRVGLASVEEGGGREEGGRGEGGRGEGGREEGGERGGEGGGGGGRGERREEGGGAEQRERKGETGKRDEVV